MKKLCIMLLCVLVLMACKKAPAEDTVVHRTDSVQTIIKICIEDHLYYHTPWYHQGGIAPVLTDDGKPVHCN